jgi:hypothetical protein
VDDITFDRLAARTNMRPISRQMARRILVDGLSAAAAGREVGKSRALASRAEWRIRAEAAQAGACPTCGRPR